MNVGRSSASSEISLADVRRRDNAFACLLVLSVLYCTWKLNSASRSCHIVSLPDGSVIVSIKPSAEWYVSTINFSEKRFARRVFRAHSTARDSS